MRAVTVTASSVVANVLSRARVGRAAPPNADERAIADHIVQRLASFGLRPSIEAEAFVCGSFDERARATDEALTRANEPGARPAAVPPETPKENA